MKRSELIGSELIDPVEEWNDAFRWMLSLAAWSAYKRYDALLCGDPSPNQKADYERITKPEIGDIVLETSKVHASIGWEDWDQLNRALGVLIDKQPERGYQSSFEWTVLSLSPVPTWTNWTNCQFIVVDTPPFLPVCPHCHGTGQNCPKERVPHHPENEVTGYCVNGRWLYPRIFTRESLTHALAGDGFEVKSS